MNERCERAAKGGRRFRPAALAMALAAVAPFLIPFAAPLEAEQPSAADVCDPGLESRGEDPRAYRLRGDRCEGIYRLKVNSDKIRLLSWTAWFEDYDYQDETPLRVSWSLPENAPGTVRLRASALNKDTLYRMDTRLSGTATPWTWPTQFLGQLRLGRRDVGLVGWTTLAVAGREKRVHLPLEVRQNGAGRPDGYRVTLVPEARLREVRWSLAPVLEGGGVGAPIVEDQSLQRGLYPARKPTVFTVPAPAERGLYALDLAADVRTGDRANRRLWFYHHGFGGTAEAMPGAEVSP